jgi:hypothetical protein
MEQRKRFTIHIIATKVRANYTIRLVEAATAEIAAASKSPWIHLQSKVDLYLDMSLNVVKWKYIWLQTAMSIDLKHARRSYRLFLTR